MASGLLTSHTFSHSLTPGLQVTFALLLVFHVQGAWEHSVSCSIVLPLFAEIP